MLLDSSEDLYTRDRSLLLLCMPLVLFSLPTHTRTRTHTHTHTHKRNIRLWELHSRLVGNSSIAKWGIHICKYFWYLYFCPAFSLQVFAIEVVTFATDFVLSAIEFVTFAVEFVAFAIKLVTTVLN